VDGWDQGDHLARAAARAGLDLGETEAAIATDPGAYEEMLTQNDRALREAGHWGVPTMVYRGEPLFGQDRIDLLAWRLDGSPDGGPEALMRSSFGLPSSSSVCSMTE
jgi:2-hydroxychromene-2-carboxylate isomerase